jgi:hypothetical protein
MKGFKMKLLGVNPVKEKTPEITDDVIQSSVHKHKMTGSVSFCDDNTNKCRI